MGSEEAHPGSDDSYKANEDQRMIGVKWGEDIQLLAVDMVPRSVKKATEEEQARAGDPDV